MRGRSRPTPRASLATRACMTWSACSKASRLARRAWSGSRMRGRRGARRRALRTWARSDERVPDPAHAHDRPGVLARGARRSGLRQGEGRGPRHARATRGLCRRSSNADRERRDPPAARWHSVERRRLPRDAHGLSGPRQRVRPPAIRRGVDCPTQPSLPGPLDRETGADRGRGATPAGGGTPADRRGAATGRSRACEEDGLPRRGEARRRQAPVGPREADVLTMRLNVARVLPRSAANGPGDRFVVWVQGCPLACTGCWNPDTWPFERRDLREVDALVAEILATDGIEGVTFTGGEAFVQARALAELAHRVRGAGLSVFVFTGHERAELTEPEHRTLLALADVVVSGRYVEARRSLDLPWRGSANQQVHFLTRRYGPADLLRAPEIEFLIGAD